LIDPPILSAQEEHDLAVELYENHDLSAARKLVLSHIRFVAFIAHGYKGYGLEQADIPIYAKASLLLVLSNKGFK
jgi:RNA polymerase sigma-32 factor